MKRHFTALALFVFILSLLVSPALANPWDGVTIPEDLSEKESNWFIGANEDLYKMDYQTPFSSGDIFLNIVGSNDERGYEVPGDLWFGTEPYEFLPQDTQPVPGPEVLFGDSTTLNVITKSDSVNIPITYVNSTDLAGTFSTSFYGGASLSAEGLQANTSGDVTLDVSVPSTRGFYTLDTVSLGEHSWPQVRPWVDCLDESLFNKILIARVLDRPYYEVMYSNYGGAIPYGYPSSTYPLIRRGLTPSRFSDNDDLTIDLGTVFVSMHHSWPRFDDYPGSGSWNPGQNIETNYAGKGRSLMVKITNWGSQQQVPNIHPLETGFESFALRMKKIDCDTDWPAWGWSDYLNDGDIDNSDFWEFPLSSNYDWPLPPAFSVMYWGGRFGNEPTDEVMPTSSMNAALAETVPYNRTYSDGANSFTVEVGGNTFTFNWTPKEFETLGSIFPDPGMSDDEDLAGQLEEEVDPVASQLASYAWTVGDGWKFPDIDSPDLYQGSGLVMHLVSFDIASTDTGGLETFLPLYDFENESADIVTVVEVPEEDAIEGNATAAIVVEVPFSDDQWTLLSEEVTSEDLLPVMPIHTFAYFTEDLMKDLDSQAYDEFVQAIAEDTPIDMAFMDHFRIQVMSPGGYSTDLVEAVKAAGQDPTNYFRVVGNTKRVCVHFFAALADSHELKTEVKDGYFLLYDGEENNLFEAAFPFTISEKPEEPVDPPVDETLKMGGTCSVGTFPLFALLLIVPLFWTCKRR